MEEDDLLLYVVIDILEVVAIVNDFNTLSTITAKYI
jgi:hypothetical protein